MNYRYVIIEDEMIVRRGLELKMQLAHLPFELVGTAANGQEGLDLIRKTKPDLAFTDILMPEMNGIQLLEALRKEGLSTEVIVISGYSNFEYARAGIRANVCEYLLKPFSEEELRNAVHTAMTRMEKKGVVMPNVETNRREEELRLLSDELMGVHNLTQSTAFSEFNIDPDRGRYVVMDVMHPESLISLTKPELLDELVCIDAPGEKNRTFVILYARNGISENVVRQVAAECSDADSIGISLPCDHLQAARHQAQEARRDRPIRAHGTVHTFHPTDPRDSGKAVMDDPLRDRMIFALENGDENWFQTEFMRWYERCADLGWTVNRFLNACRLFFEYLINHFPLDAHAEKPTLFQFDYLTARAADDAQLPESIQKFILRSFHAEASGSASKSISQLRSYLDNHFGEDLSLERIGSLFNVSPGYISRMFSQLFGVSYSSYISTLRINHSCTLLRENTLDITKIASRCGFSSSKYFFRVFKSHMGCTPSEYRQHILEAESGKTTQK